MIAWALFFAAAFGISYVLAAAHISMPLREWLSTRKSLFARWLLLFLECVACTGAHLGWTSVLLGIAPIARTSLNAFEVGCAVMTINLILARITGLTKE